MKLDRIKRTISFYAVGAVFTLCTTPVFGAPPDDATPHRVQYRGPGGELITRDVTAQQVRIVSRKENLSAVCVYMDSVGKVWIAPALWMVGSAGGETREPARGGRVAGGGNGFGSIRDIPVSPTCE